MKTTNNPMTESTEIQNSTKVNNEKSTPRFWQSVLVGGVPGILIGAGVSSALAKQPIAEPGGQHPDDPENNPGETPGVAEVQVAHSVSDDMSFSEAFAAARNEVGPGGAFVWHGNVYGTFRGDDAEWQAMSAEERAEHSQAILSQVHPVPYTPTEHEPIIEVVEDNTPATTTEEAEGGQEDEVDIHIVGVEQGQTEDGTIITVGYGAVDGQYAEFVDTDGDGEVDTVLIDHNDNQELDEGEIHGVTGSLTVDDMVAAAQENTAAAVDDALYGEMPDYTNDADTSSYV